MSDTDVYLPTAEEIEAACLRIQAGWTESEQIRRQYSHCEVSQEKAVAEHFARIVPTVADGVLVLDLPLFEPPIDL